MIVKRWLVNEIFNPRAPIGELEVDGVAKPLYGPQLSGGDFGMIYRFYVTEGNEIGPFGELFDYQGCPSFAVSDGKVRAPLHSMAKLKRTRRDRYPAIFLNYRRDDADAYAGRLHEALTREFGDDNVFMAEFSIRPGEIWDGQFSRRLSMLAWCSRWSALGG